MHAEDEQTAMSQSAPSHDSLTHESLTDVIDQMDRRAFQRALERRHAAGLAITIFLLFATVLGYLAYRQLWAEAKRVVRPTGALDPKNQAKSRSAKAKAGVRG